MIGRSPLLQWRKPDVVESARLWRVPKPSMGLADCAGASRARDWPRLCPVRHRVWAWLCRRVSWRGAGVAADGPAAARFGTTPFGEQSLVRESPGPIIRLRLRARAHCHQQQSDQPRDLRHGASTCLSDPPGLTTTPPSTTRSRRRPASPGSGNSRSARSPCCRRRRGRRPSRGSRARRCRCAAARP
jgi:hypothetical protein